MRTRLFTQHLASVGSFVINSLSLVCISKLLCYILETRNRTSSRGQFVLKHTMFCKRRAQYHVSCIVEQANEHRTALRTEQQQRLKSETSENFSTEAVKSHEQIFVLIRLENGSFQD